MLSVFSFSFVFFFKQKTAYEMRISDWSSDVCSSDLTLWSISRRLVRVPLSLADVLEPRVPPLPPLDVAADGILITSLPEARVAAVPAQAPGLVAFVRQRYTPYFADVGGGFVAWLGGSQSNTRFGMNTPSPKLRQSHGST